MKPILCPDLAAHFSLFPYEVSLPFWQVTQQSSAPADTHPSWQGGLGQGTLWDLPDCRLEDGGSGVARARGSVCSCPPVSGRLLPLVSCLNNQAPQGKGNLFVPHAAQWARHRGWVL